MPLCATTRRVATMVIASLVAAACLHETNRFPLGADSKLPVWFRLPAGVRRSDVRLTITFIGPGPDAEVVLQRVNGDVLDRVRGPAEWHVFTREAMKLSGPVFYPRYTVVFARGVAEVFEQRQVRGPFYVTEDQQIIDMNNDAIARGKRGTTSR